jgi:hypothetical protein
LLQHIQRLKVGVGGVAIRRWTWVGYLARQETPDEASEEWSHGVWLVLQKIHDSSHAHTEKSHLQFLQCYFYRNATYDYFLDLWDNGSKRLREINHRKKKQRKK